MSAAATGPLVSVIIVNYNGVRFLPELFDSLRQAFERHRAELIVVDNASSDGSVAWLEHRAATQALTLIALDSNTGFCWGNNVGATHARGDVLLLLNNDTRWAGPLDALIDCAMDPRVGAAGCQLRYGDGRLQHTIGLEHHATRIALSWLGLEKRARAPALLRKMQADPRRYEQPQQGVAWVSGACLATRRQVWQLLDGLDPAYFMYCEDVDYCRRVRALGLRVDYVPAPVVTHLEGAGKPWVGALALLRTVRSYHLLMGKTAGPVRARLLDAALAVVFALRALAFAALAPLAHSQRTRSVRRDKSVAFKRAAAVAGQAALTGRVPPLC